MEITWENSGKKNQRFIHQIALIIAKRFVVRGKGFLVKGSLKEALACCEKSLSMCNDLHSAYELMAEALMPGDNYLDVLSHFHNFIKPESYVEIGVFEGNSLALAKEDTKVIGIDPSPCITETINSLAKIYPLPSDDFFRVYNLHNELGTSRLPLAFIDGLHLFDQTLNDFIHLERYAQKDTIILIHDCLPITRLAASRSRSTLFWCGDVWKIIPCLKKYRPDLIIRIIPAYPSGLGMITNLDPSSTVLQNHYNHIIVEYQDQELGYNYLKPEILRNMDLLIDNDWQHIKYTLR
jgi:hypothetical protein